MTHVGAERAVDVVVLAVDVACDRATHAHDLGARRDGTETSRAGASVA